MIKLIIKNRHLINKANFYRFFKSPIYWSKFILYKLSTKDFFNKILTVKIKTKEQKNKYLIISAVYNVEKYLNDYFTSITKQSYSFIDNIKIIAVDDGSTDKSLAILKSWQKKHPKNIVIIEKENAGQASARNLGIKYAKENNLEKKYDYVSFTDPDDFIDKNYYKKADKFIAKNKTVKLFCARLVSFYEDKNLKKIDHPLDFRFTDGNCIVDVNSDKNMQLSMATAFLSLKIIIKKIYIKVDTGINPSLEDAHFIQNYIHLSQALNIGVISNAQYFYRKRSTKNSSSNTAWTKKNQYLGVIEKSCLQILKLTPLPEKHQQSYVFYALFWYIKQFYINSNFPFQINKQIDLTSKDKKTTLNLLRESALLIDEKIIFNFSIKHIFYEHRIMFLALKNPKIIPYMRLVYVTNIDLEKKDISVRGFISTDCILDVYLNNKKTNLIASSKIPKKIFDETIMFEVFSTINFEDINDVLSVKIGQKEAILRINLKNYESRMQIKEIADIFYQENEILFFEYQLFRKYEKLQHSKKNIYKNCWIFIDCDVRADDNAEHLYRYIQKNKLEKNIYFALRKKSKDWQRLKNDGFNLLEYDKVDFKLALLNAKYLLSSHVDNYITHYFSKESFFSTKIRYKFIFLQHGITKDDISNWLNHRKIDLFITANQRERASIASENSNYKFTKNEVKLTGFARHDRLLKLSQNNSKNQILIMPTWRKNLLDKPFVRSNDRTGIKQNANLEFFNYWSIAINQIAKNYINTDYEIVFIPHPNLETTIKLFNLPDNVICKLYKKISIQNYLSKSYLLITDFSSIAMDGAYINSNILYYQFNRESFFTEGENSNGYKKGYFDYFKDGFGPVCENLEEFKTSLEKETFLEPVYQKKRDEFFTLKDGNCCKRIYNEALKLNKPIKQNENIIKNQETEIV